MNAASPPNKPVPMVLAKISLCGCEYLDGKESVNIVQ